MTGDNGLAMGTQQIEAEVIYTITLIQVIDEGRLTRPLTPRSTDRLQHRLTCFSSRTQ
jgi:hypothetical protein